MKFESEKVFAPRFPYPENALFLSGEDYDQATKTMRAGEPLEVKVDMLDPSTSIWRIGDELRIYNSEDDDPCQCIFVVVSEMAIVDQTFHYFLLTRYGQFIQTARLTKEGKLPNE